MSANRRAPMVRSRRSLVLLTGAAVSVAVATAPAGLAPAGATTVGSPWSQTNASPGLGRSNLTEKTLSPANVANVMLLRSLASAPATGFSAACDTGPAASPVLVGGNVYDTGNQQLSKYSAHTGHLTWRVTLANSPDDPEVFPDLAVSGGLVLVAEDDCISQSDPDGVVAAYNATSGAHVWTVDPLEPVTSMVVSGPNVVLEGDSVGAGDIVGVYKLSTGAKVWQVENQPCGPWHAIVVHSMVMREVCNPITGYYSVEADRMTTGVTVWHLAHISLPLSRGTDSVPNGRLYVTNSKGKIEDLNAATGATRLVLSGATSLLAVDLTRVYANCGATRVCGFSQATGKQIWHLADSSTRGAEANGVLYLGDGQTVNAATGTVIHRLWKLKATSLAVGDGRVAVVKPPANLDAATLQLYGLAGE